MNPLLIAAIGVAVIAFIKTRKDAANQNDGIGSGPGTGGSLGDVVAGNTQMAPDGLYALQDGLAIGGIILTVAGTAGAVATAAGTTTGAVLGAAGAALAANPVTIVLVVIAAIIITLEETGQRLAGGKNMVAELKNHLPNARRLHQFEVSMLKELVKQNGAGTLRLVKTVVDPRLEMRLSDNTHLVGERGVYELVKSTAPTHGTPPSFIDLQKAARSFSLKYVSEMSRYAASMLNNWGPKIGGASSFQLANDDFYQNHLYDDLEWIGQGSDKKLGGLAQIPLAGGYTESPLDAAGEQNPTAAQLRGINTAGIENAAVIATYPAARFQAFISVLKTVTFDPGFYLPFDAHRYMLDVYNRMDLAPPYFAAHPTNPIITLPGPAWNFRLPDGTLANCLIDIQRIKDNDPGAIWSESYK